MRSALTATTGCFIAALLLVNVNVNVIVAARALHSARPKIKLFYSLKTPCAWRNSLFGGEVRQCAWLLVFVIVNVRKLFENNFPSILDIDATRGIRHLTALEVVVGGEDCITGDGRNGCYFIDIEQIDALGIAIYRQ